MNVWISFCLIRCGVGATYVSKLIGLDTIPAMPIVEAFFPIKCVHGLFLSAFHASERISNSFTWYTHMPPQRNATDTVCVKQNAVQNRINPAALNTISNFMECSSLFGVVVMSRNHEARTHSNVAGNNIL